MMGEQSIWQKCKVGMGVSDALSRVIDIHWQCQVFMQCVDGLLPNRGKGGASTRPLISNNKCF